MSHPLDPLIAHVVKIAHDELVQVQLTEGETRLKWLLQARAHIDEAIAFAKTQTTKGPTP